MQTGRTALSWAAYQGHKQVVHILLNKEANPDIQDQVVSLCVCVCVWTFYVSVCGMCVHVYIVCVHVCVYNVCVCAMHFAGYEKGVDHHKVGQW